MYLTKLTDHGVMVFDVSNRHLNLEQVLGNLARDRGLVCYNQQDQQTAGRPFKLPSQFAVMARNNEDLGKVVNDPRWQPCETTSDPEDVWTDDFSNILSTFNWH